MRLAPPRRAWFAQAVCTLALLGTPALPAWGQADAGDDPALREFYSGNGFLNRGLYDLAIEEYAQFLDAHPDHEQAPVARYGMAVSLFHLQRYESAADELTTLRTAADFDFAPVAELMLGQCRLFRGEYGHAVESFATVLDRWPRHDMADEAAALQAEALYHAGDHARVDAPCATLIENWPDSPLRERAEFFRGLATIARNDMKTAAQRFQELADRYPDGAFADQTGLLLARCLHRSERNDRARDQYQRVLERPDNAFVPDALYGLALLLHQQGKPEQSVPLLDRLLAEYGGHELVLDATLLRGRAFFDLKKYDDAFAAFERVGERPGDRGDDAAYWMAKCELRQGRAHRAAERLDHALAQYTDSELRAEMTFDRGVALMRMDDLDGVLDTLAAFRASFPEHALAPDAVHLMASALHRLDRFDESAELCARFAEDYPRHELRPEVAFLGAENAFLQKQYAPAAAAFDRFLQEHGDRPEAREATYRLGMALYHLGRHDAAAPYLADLSHEPDAQGADPFRLALFALGDINFQKGAWTDAETHLTAYLGGSGDRAAGDDARLKLGLAQLRQDRPEDALAHFETLIAGAAPGPHVTQAMFERGQALVALNRPDDASDAFLALLDTDATSRFAPYALNHLGAIAYEQQRYGAAAAYFDRLTSSEIEMTPLAAGALFQGGQSLLAAGELERAADRLARLLDEHPDHERVPDAAALRAIASARQGDHAAALELIEDVEATYRATIEPSILAPMLYEKAWCQRGLDRPDDAHATYRDLLGVDAAGELALHASLELAELDAEAKRYADAATRLRELRTTLAASPAAPPHLDEQAAYRLGVCEFRQERFEPAADVLTAFLDEYVGSDMTASALLLCGEANVKLGRHQVAITHLETLTGTFADDDGCGPALLRLGESLAVLHYWDRSETAYIEYLKRFPKSEHWFQAQFGRAWAEEHQDRLDEAIATYRTLVDAHKGPTAARALFQIGERLFAQERFDEAVRDLLKVDILYAYPEWSAAALYEAGRCFRRMNDPVQARRQFEQVRERFGETEWAALAAGQLEEMKRTSLPGRGPR